MDDLGLNDRQKRAVAYLKEKGSVTNREYQDLTGAIVRTAARDLKGLVDSGVCLQVGRTGRSAHYVLARKQDRNRTEPA